MRIIDKNTDFYDYCQYVYQDDSVVFDRRGSRILSKGEVAIKIQMYKEWNTDMLLRIGYDFWVLKTEMMEEFRNSITFYGDRDYYEITPIVHFKNYNIAKTPIDLSCIRYVLFGSKGFVDKKYLRNELSADDKMYFVNTSQIKEYKVVPYIPILKDTGITKFINPEEAYFALEEYFMMQKTMSERTDPIGISNDDRIVMHGFDPATSFRTTK